MVRGIGTSKGIGMGRALLIDPAEIEVNVICVEDPQVEKNRYLQAKNTFTEETERIIEDLIERLGDKDKTSLILKNQIYLINDKELNNKIETAIYDRKICAEAAVEEICNQYISLFSSMENETMNQRVTDIVDMKNRMIGILLGTEQIDLQNLNPGTIIVAKQLQPSVTAVMDTAHIAGIVAEKGGDTSHASILARALEIPAVLSVKDCCSKIQNGDYVIVDGDYGEVFVNPIPKTIEIYEKKRSNYLEKVQELKKYQGKQTQTQDGCKVFLAANIGNDDDARKAMEAGAEGVGLFRTEFLFMNGISMPTEEEQLEVYRRAAVLCKNKPLTIRTIDIGGDKDIPYMGLTRENNPFLGYRAIRYCLGRIDIFTVQLRAILRASAYGNVRIMIPLVTSVSEIGAVKKLVYQLMQELDHQDIKYDKDIQIGVMIETPAAAIMADVLAKEADFFSIGTNDLTQYMIAVDRGNENVAYLYSVFHPAVLRSVKMIIEAAKKQNIEVGMCGEAAGSPQMIPLLLAFGLDEFSVTASKILETRKNIAMWTLQEAQEVAGKVMNMYTEKEVSDYLNAYIANKEGK